MWHLTFYRRLEPSEREHAKAGSNALSLTPFRLLECISGTEEEIFGYWHSFVDTGLVIAAEICHEGGVVERYIAPDELINGGSHG